MSYSERDGENSNSAIVCSVRPEDYPHGILGGIELQRIIERNAFIKAEGYGAPAMNIDDFIKGESSKRLNIDTSYNPYVKIGNYSSCLPNFISNPLRMAMSQYDNSIKGFTKGIMLGVETRTSSPVRILRDDDGQSIKGIYPAGEGAGYAGGIVSAAVDGIKAAEHIIRRFSGEV